MMIKLEFFYRNRVPDLINFFGHTKINA